MNNKSFTLIELLVVTGIILFLSAIIFPNFRLGERQFALQRSTHKLAQDIRRSQEMAMSAREFNQMNPLGGYGVYLTTETPDSYILFADCDGYYDYDPTGIPCGGVSEKIEEINFEKKVEISSLFPSPLTITFTPPDPTVRINQLTPSSATITLIIDNTTKTINLNSAGLIEIE